MQREEIALDSLLGCRLAPHLGRRVGGQGLVIFAQHTNAPTRQFAVKFFLSRAAFEAEMNAALNPVRRLPWFLMRFPAFSFSTLTLSQAVAMWPATVSVPSVCTTVLMRSGLAHPTNTVPVARSSALL